MGFSKDVDAQSIAPIKSNDPSKSSETYYQKLGIREDAKSSDIGKEENIKLHTQIAREKGIPQAEIDKMFKTLVYNNHRTAYDSHLTKGGDSDKFEIDKSGFYKNKDGIDSKTASLSTKDASTVVANSKLGNTLKDLTTNDKDKAPTNNSLPGAVSTANLAADKSALAGAGTQSLAAKGGTAAQSSESKGSPAEGEGKEKKPHFSINAKMAMGAILMLGFAGGPIGILAAIAVVAIGAACKVGYDKIKEHQEKQSAQSKGSQSAEQAQQKNTALEKGQGQSFDTSKLSEADKKALSGVSAKLQSSGVQDNGPVSHNAIKPPTVAKAEPNIALASAAARG